MSTSKNIQKTFIFKSAFTLIELLIVITIIGILATFMVASFINAQKKVRDSRRKADINALQKAFELAKSDSIYGISYPGCALGFKPICLVDVGRIVPELAPTYIKTIPYEPLDPFVNAYVYNPRPDGCDYAGPAPACSSYFIYACMEIPSNGVAGPYSCNAGRTPYVLTSP